jgi:perosamine synthetase
MMIPLSVPNISPEEQRLVAEAVQSGWVSTGGPMIPRFEAALSAYTGAAHVVALNSGTAALHLALRVAEVQPGDLVLVSNMTYTATVNAVHYVQAEPVLVDVAADTLLMDADLVAAYLRDETEFRAGRSYARATGQRIAAILVVHVLGYAADLARLSALARAHGVVLIEDAAAAVGSRLHGQHLGTTGLLGILSFNGNKVLTTGGGGALLTHDPRLADRARHLALQAKSFPAEYIHDDVGYNYGMTNVAAAMGLAQLARLDGFVARKRAVHAFYAARFAGTDFQHFSPDIPGAEGNHWLEVLRHPQAWALGEALEAQGIQARKLWVPMNRLPMNRTFRYLTQDDHSQRYYENAMCVPCSSGITDQELEHVAVAILRFGRLG